MSAISRTKVQFITISLSPLFLCGFEWLHGQSDASYPWLTSGYMLVYTPLAQVAEFVGVYGLSLLIGVVNALIAYAIVGSHRKLTLVIATLVIAPWLGVGYFLEWNAKSEIHGNSINVALIQPNENPWDKWSDPRLQLSNHMRITDSVRRYLADSINRNGKVLLGRKRLLVVWSETAIPYTIRQPSHADDFAKLRHWIDTSNIVLLTGYADLVAYAQGTAPPSARRSTLDSSVRYDAFNAAMTMWPGITDIPVHRKTNLTPFAERLPFADQLTFAMQWIEWGVGISAWGKGRVRRPLPIVTVYQMGSATGKSDSDIVGKFGSDNTRNIDPDTSVHSHTNSGVGNDTAANLGAIICIESVYPEMVRDVVNNGADLLCVITNDAWYNGTTGPWQHFDISRMRAIEQRRTVIRCANSGITGAIDPTGRTIAIIEPVTQGSCNVSVTTSSKRTVYATLGDVLPPIALIVSLLSFLTARFPSLIRKMPFPKRY